MSADGQQDFAFAFLSILFEGAPFILLGTLISGFIDIYLPSDAMDRLLPKRALLAIFVAGLLGGILPVCECAVVPVIRRLMKKGLPVSCALTYMLAAPIVNPVTALSTWKAFKGPEIELSLSEPEPLSVTDGSVSANATVASKPPSVSASTLMTVSRLGLGFLMAVLVGIVVLRVPLRRMIRPRLLKSLEKPDPHHHHEHEHGDECCGGHDHGHDDHAHKHLAGSRMVAAFRSAMRDFTDVGVYFVIGVAITALFNTGIAPGANWLDTLAENPWQAPAALMVLAFVLSLCSTSDAFIAATLDKFTWGAKLAFLTFGPMMDVKLIFLYQTVLKRRFILALAAGLFIAIGLISIFWQIGFDLLTS